MAKRTLVLRGFPEWMSHADRELTVDKAVREAGLTGTDWDLTTSSMDDGQRKRKLSQVSTLTVPTFGIRQKLLDHSSRLYAWYWEEEKITPTTTTEKDDVSTITGFDQGAEQGSGQGESQPADGKGKDSQTPSQPTFTWFKQKMNGVVVKVFAGITQFERRLGALMHGLMNAYQQAFQEVLEKELLVPKWKTLILTHQGGSWLGRVLYSRRHSSLNPGDWVCTIQRSIKTSFYPPGGMCGTTSSDSRSTKRQWSSRRLRQRHSPPHRTMLQQFAFPGSSQGASLLTMQGKRRASTTGWLVLSMSTLDSSTSPSCQASTLIVFISQTCEMSRSS